MLFGKTLTDKLYNVITIEALKMEMRFVIIPEENLLLQKFIGELTYDDWYQSALEIWEHPNYNKLLRGIIDFREAEIKMGVPEIRSIVNVLTDESGSGLRADTIVLANQPVVAAFAGIVADSVRKYYNTIISTTEEGAAAKVNVDRAVFKKLRGPDVVVKTFG